MSTEKQALPSRREFVRRVSQTAAFATPLMFAIGASPAAAEDGSTYEKVKASLDKATPLIAQARRDAANLEAEERSKLRSTVNKLREEVGKLNHYF
ncbi:MAG: hypothetical protein GY769_03280 [bacterium]|nr:hypothetical protein [bacterium]